MCFLYSYTDSLAVKVSLAAKVLLRMQDGQPVLDGVVDHRPQLRDLAFRCLARCLGGCCVCMFVCAVVARHIE